MARKPVHLTRTGHRPEGRDVIWRAIRELRQFTRLDIEHATRINVDTVRTYLTGLVKAGYLSYERHAEHGDTRFAQARYQLLRDVGVEAPRVTRDGKPVQQGAGRESTWRAIRVLGEFSLEDVVGAAASGPTQPARSEVETYLRILARAGYLKRQGRGAKARYRLIPSRNTGPKAPMVQRTKRLYDPNTNQVVWTEEEGA